ncbi:MAG TPA: DUF1302 family protein [Myxococcota bacterium]|nr:DUF1302 family protein [Myxococcota bacterium]
MRWLLLAALLAAAGPALADSDASTAPDPAASAPKLSTRVRGEWAIETNGNRAGDSQTLGLEIEPQIQLPLPDHFALDAIGRLRLDAYDRLGFTGNQAVAPMTRAAQLGQNGDLALRELFVSGSVGPVYLRLGKQQIVWGQTDGLKLLDVVDPQEFREFILPDFDESRIPLWTADAEVPIGKAHLQLIWVPDPSTDVFPDPGKRFAFTTPLLLGPPPPPGLPVRVRHVDRPDDPISDSDGGARLSGRWHGWDLTANYLYHFSDIPLPFRDVSFENGVPSAVVRPGFERTHLFGGSCSSAFGDLTVRCELAYNLDFHSPAKSFSDRNGVVRADQLDYVIGLDWYHFENTLLSLQIFQSWAVQNASQLVRDPLEANLTLLARRTFLNERLTLETMWIQNLNRGDGLVRPKIRYELRDRLFVWLGFDVFYGKRRGVFGEFDDNSRAVLGFEWGI